MHRPPRDCGDFVQRNDIRSSHRHSGCCHGWAEIEFKDKLRIMKSVFGKPHDPGQGVLSIQVGVTSGTIRPLAKTVRGLLCTIE